MKYFKIGFHDSTVDKMREHQGFTGLPDVLDVLIVDMFIEEAILTALEDKHDPNDMLFSTEPIEEGNKI
jgi:hypothetical protein